MWETWNIGTSRLSADHCTFVLSGFSQLHLQLCLICLLLPKLELHFICVAELWVQKTLDCEVNSTTWEHQPPCTHGHLMGLWHGKFSLPCCLVPFIIVKVSTLNIWVPKVGRPCREQLSVTWVLPSLSVNFFPCWKHFLAELPLWLVSSPTNLWL